MKIPDTTTCLECGKIILGRTDKKFCNLACKNKYNNQRLKEKKERRLNIIRKLSRNYEILESLLEEEQSFYYIEELIKLGFDIRYITEVRHLGSRNQIFLCFDIAYSLSGSRISKIRRDSLTRF